MPKQMEGMQQLLIDELQDLYDAEKQLVRALPKLAKSASNEELADALQQHLEVTKGQVQRLESVFESMNMRAKSKPCRGMKGMVEEGQEMIAEELEEPALDAGLIGCARRVEHYEMAAYDTACSIAQQLGLRDAAQLLQETLREETDADRQLSQIAKRVLKSRGSAAQSEAGNGSRQRSKRAATSKSSRGGNSRGKAGGSAQPLTDHEEIREWAEERGAKPACVRGTGGAGDIGMLRLDFPGYTGGDSLQEISWDDWFEKFDNAT